MVCVLMRAASWIFAFIWLWRVTGARRTEPIRSIDVACDAVTSCRLGAPFGDHAARRAAKRTFACARTPTFGGAHRGRQEVWSFTFRQTIAHAVRLRIAFFPATMAYHMSAQQYDATFKPTRLNNWEVPAIREREPMPRPGLPLGADRR